MRVVRVVAGLLASVSFSGALVVKAQVPQLPMQGPRVVEAAPIPLPPVNPAAPAQLTPEDVTAFLDGFLPLQLQRDDVAGATISIVQNGQTLIQKGYGYADWKKKTPVDPVTTTFRPGSISKTFTYVSMMQLVEQGKLDLDADVSRYIDFTINPGGAGIGNAPITLRELCTHTAGFEEELHDFGSDKSGKLPIGLGDFLKRNQPKRFAAPGKALAYSNYGIALVGYIVQRVSGEPFAEYVQRHVFGPLGMVHSTFVQPLPAGMVATKGYNTTDKPDTGFEGVTESPAGGLSSTAADMAIFGQMLLGQGTYKGVKVLEPASVATLFTPQFTPAPGVSPWDLGFYTERRNGLDFVGHGGDLIACHSQFWVEPKHGLSFFISYNSAGSAKIAREELFRAFVDRYLPGAPAPHPAYLKMSAKELGAYAGYYLSSRREDSTKLRILGGLSPRQIEVNKDGYLTFASAKDFRGQPLRFHPIGNDSFYEEEAQGTLHFERDAKGRVTGVAGPGHVDRAGFMLWPTVLMPALIGSLLAVALVVLAILVRIWMRIFYRKRLRPIPQPRTIWVTRPLQLACWSVVAVVVYLVALGTHIGDVTSFYQIGHLDRWFMVQNVVSGIALVAIFVGVLSGLASLTRPVRLITKTKMLLVTLACAYMGWFLIYFHFVGSATRY
jgi:CubicO group peptidase (beta-lactamase class C family)